MEDLTVQPDKRYVFYKAQHSRRNGGIIQIACSDGRMLKLYIDDMPKKLTRMYMTIIKRWPQVKKSVTAAVNAWHMTEATCTVDTMQGVIDKWKE